MDLVIFDLETTGLSPMANDIIQIAAVRVRLGNILRAENFSTFVNPGCSIPAFITCYTGISNADVRNAPKVPIALQQFSRFVGENTLVAHNGHRFDMPFIRAACEKSRLPMRAIGYADSIYLSKKVWQSSRRHSLDAVLERLRLNISGYKRHDARGDVGILAEAVVKMWRQLTPGCAALPVPIFPGVLPR
jgi:DNA polymerase III alpha subunit (gram-positive type)